MGARRDRDAAYRRPAIACFPLPEPEELRVCRRGKRKAPPPVRGLRWDRQQARGRSLVKPRGSQAKMAPLQTALPHLRPAPEWACLRLRAALAAYLSAPLIPERRVPSHWRLREQEPGARDLPR